MFELDLPFKRSTEAVSLCDYGESAIRPWKTQAESTDCLG